MGSLPSHKPRGAALIIALVITLVTIIVIVAVVRMVTPFLQTSTFFASSNVAYFAAEGALENALYDMTEHDPGYETVGPNAGSTPVALLPHFLTPLAYADESAFEVFTDDFQMAIPTCMDGPATSFETKPSTAACTDQNFSSNIPKCCAPSFLEDGDTARFRARCERVIRASGLLQETPTLEGARNTLTPEGNPCLEVEEVNGEKRYNDACLTQLITQFEAKKAGTCASTAQAFVRGPKVTSGFQISSLRTVIPLPGEGTAEARVFQTGTTIPTEPHYDWNMVNQQEPIILPLFYETGAYGKTRRVTHVPVKASGDICTSGPAGGDVKVYIRVPILDTQTEVGRYDDSVDDDKKVEQVPEVWRTQYVPNINNDAVLSWQVSGYKLEGGVINYGTSYTLYSGIVKKGSFVENTDIKETQINTVTDQNSVLSPTLGMDMVLNLSSVGIPDSTFVADYGPTTCKEGVSIAYFLRQVAKPVLKITMISQPLVTYKGEKIRYPYLEYKVVIEQSSGAAGNPPRIPNPYAFIRAAGETLNTERRGFKQQVEAKVRTDTPASIVDYTIFQ